MALEWTENQVGFVHMDNSGLVVAKDINTARVQLFQHTGQVSA